MIFLRPKRPREKGLRELSLRFDTPLPLNFVEFQFVAEETLHNVHLHFLSTRGEHTLQNTSRLLQKLSKKSAEIRRWQTEPKFLGQVLILQDQVEGVAFEKW